MTKEVPKIDDMSVMEELKLIIISGFMLGYLLAINCAICYFTQNDLPCMGSDADAPDL